MAKEETKVEVETFVVNQLPQVQTRIATVDGKDVGLITIEEALTEILKIARELKRGLI